MQAGIPAVYGFADAAAMISSRVARAGTRSTVETVTMCLLAAWRTTDFVAKTVMTQWTAARQ
jgi:hypothetical protein